MVRHRGMLCAAQWFRGVFGAGARSGDVLVNCVQQNLSTGVASDQHSHVPPHSVLMEGGDRAAGAGVQLGAQLPRGGVEEVQRPRLVSENNIVTGPKLLPFLRSGAHHLGCGDVCLRLHCHSWLHEVRPCLCLEPEGAPPSLHAARRVQAATALDWWGTVPGKGSCAWVQAAEGLASNHPLKLEHSLLFPGDVFHQAGHERPAREDALLQGSHLCLHLFKLLSA
mmetsp:Transcript_31171/g.88372  ORF Transcript_31171/g.88372 Transcript_31171/m.88372 type:complete len:224 (-) Transcript_31171:552-1223(-)